MTLILALLLSFSSAVADAVMKGDNISLRALLQQRADVNAPQADGATALHWAVYRDDLQSVDLLIRAGANVKAVNRDGASVLSLACMNGNAAMIEKVLKAGADPNERSANGETPLMIAARTGNVDAINLLLARGAGARSGGTSKGRTAYLAPTVKERARSERPARQAAGTAAAADVDQDVAERIAFLLEKTANAEDRCKGEAS